MKRVLFGAVALVAFSFVANAQFVGSKNSDKYHKQECQWAKRISESNLRTFDSAEEASDAGYQPCKVCKPPTSGKAEVVKRNQGTVRRGSTISDDGRCQAITKKGTRCSRRAQSGSRYCWQHQRS